MSNHIYDLSKGGIYNIINLVNLKHYIGSAAWFHKRWQVHRNYLRSGQHCNVHLQRAWDKYGEDQFEFVVVEYIDAESELTKIEQLYLDGHTNKAVLYNICTTAGSRLGVKASLETRALLRASHLGKKQSKESIMKRNAANTGKKRTPEFCQRLSDLMLSKNFRKDWNIIFPDGHTELTHNLREFCREHQLNYGHIGQPKGTKGFKAIKVLL